MTFSACAKVGRTLTGRIDLDSVSLDAFGNKGCNLLINARSRAGSKNDVPAFLAEAFGGGIAHAPAPMMRSDFDMGHFL